MLCLRQETSLHLKAFKKSQRYLNENRQKCLGEGLAFVDNHSLDQPHMQRGNSKYKNHDLDCICLKTFISDCVFLDLVLVLSARFRGRWHTVEPKGDRDETNQSQDCNTTSSPGGNPDGRDAGNRLVGHHKTSFGPEADIGNRLASCLLDWSFCATRRVTLKK